MKEKKTDVVRRMRTSDIFQIKQIEEECGLSVWSSEDYKKETFRRNSIPFILEKNGEIIGFLTARLIKTKAEQNINQNLKSSTFTAAEIYNIAIKLNYQCKGFGQKLLDRFLKICFRKNVKEVWLEVRESNQRAIDFYTRNKFEFVYLRKNFYSMPRENAMILKREINNSQSV